MDIFYPAPCPSTGLGFWVIDYWHGDNRDWYSRSNTDFSSRAPNTPRDHASVEAHLRCMYIRGLWKSIYCTWRAALQRRQRLIREGAMQTFIYVVDLEHHSFRGTGSNLEGVVNAYHFAIANNLPNVSIYGHVRNDGLPGFPKEYLLPRGIPLDACIACIASSDSWTSEFDVHLGRMYVPSTLLEENTYEPERAVKQWAQDEIYSCTGVEDPVMVQRLLQAMCID